MAAPFPPAPTQKALWRALVDLTRLLQSQCNVEATYQRFFERHSVVFSALGFDRYASFEKASGNALPFDPERGFSPEPDFLCAQRDAGVLTVFELKTPFVDNPTTARSDGNRLKFRATAETYLSQATEYWRSIEGRLEARDVVKQVLDVPRITTYEIAVVYGFRGEWDEPSVRELLSNRKVETQLVGFDDIADHVAWQYAGDKPTESMEGWTHVYHISIPRTAERRYIADSGGVEKDRVSFVREGDLIAFECLDSQGKKHRLEAVCDEGIHYVRFEFSSGADILYMSLHIDDDEHELRLKKIPIRCDPNPASFVIGASLERKYNAPFRLFETYSIGRTMTLEERLSSHVHYLEKLKFPLYMDQ